MVFISWRSSLSNNDGLGYKNVIEKYIYAALNLIALVPSRSIRQIMANFSGAEF